MAEAFRKLAMFGATGRTGRHAVRLALDEGRRVNALVRDPRRLNLEHERLTVIVGDALDLAAVRKTLEGTDALVSLLGWTKGGASDVLEKSAENYVNAMKEQGQRRLVTLLGAGTPDPRDPDSFGRKVMHTVMKLVARRMMEDAIAHSEIVRGSGLDWSIVRPPRLTENKPAGDYRMGYYAVGPSDSLDREDLARAVLHVLDDPSQIGEAPIVSAS